MLNEMCRSLASHYLTRKPPHRRDKLANIGIVTLNSTPRNVLASPWPSTDFPCVSRNLRASSELFNTAT